MLIIHGIENNNIVIQNPLPKMLSMNPAIIPTKANMVVKINQIIARLIFSSMRLTGRFIRNPSLFL